MDMRSFSGEYGYGSLRRAKGGAQRIFRNSSPMATATETNETTPSQFRAGTPALLVIVYEAST